MACHTKALCFGLMLLGLTLRSRGASRQKLNQEARELRDDLSEKQVDRMVMDSFPASDPPSTY